MDGSESDWRRDELPERDNEQIEYVHPDTFRRWGERALALGFESVASGPLVRSSFHADELAGTVRPGESSRAR